MKKLLLLIVLSLTVFLIIFSKILWDKKIEMTIQEAEMELEQRQELRQVDLENATVTNNKGKTDFESDRDESQGPGEAMEALEEDSREVVQGASHEKSAVVDNEADENETNIVTTNAVESEADIDAKIKSSIDETKVIPEAERKSLGSIKDDYFLQFRDLERVQNQKLDEMLLEAFNEYEVLNALEQFERRVFIDKYQTKGQQQEKAADRAFYRVYEQMQQELAENGYSITGADPFKSVYESTKEQRRNSMFNILP